MLVLIRFGFTGLSLLRVQIIRLREINAPSIQQIGVLFFIGNTTEQIYMVKTDSSVISQRILYQEV